MSLHIIEEGNIFKVFKEGKQITTIGHGCNMQGVMGAGIAKQIKDKFPVSYERYRKVCNSLHISEMLAVSYLTDLNEVDTQTNVMYNVFNIFTQIEPGPNADLVLIEFAFKDLMSRVAYYHKFSDVVIPAIGCGIGGLEFDDVYEVINDIAAQYPSVNLYIIKNFKDVDVIL